MSADERLFRASENGDLAGVQQAVTEGANINAIDADYHQHRSALHYASQYGYVDVVEYLIQLDCFLDITDYILQTPLHLAARNGHLEVVKCLIDKGSNKDSKTMFNTTPLLMSAQWGHLEVVKYLVEKGCDKDNKTKSGWTPLHHASFNNQAGVVAYLLQAGCDPNIVNNDGTTPLDLSSSAEMKELFASFQPVGAKDAPITTEDPQFPGIHFLGTPYKEEVTSEGQEITWDNIGIAFSIPPGAVPEGESLKLAVHPSLTGPFQPPDHCQLTSPSYHITHSSGFTKDVELILYHSVHLKSDDDCKRMTFLSAPETPASDGSQHQYMFKELSGGVFRKHESFGRIKLRHFCHIAIGITGDKPPSVYSARLYRNSATPNGPCTRALFCIVPCQPMYTEHLNKYLEKSAPELMDSVPSINEPVEFTTTDAKAKVTLQLPGELPGYKISCDQDPVQISKKKVDYVFTSSKPPEEYPMKLFLDVLPVGESVSPGSCKLAVLGLEEDLSFKLTVGTTSTSEVKFKSTSVHLHRAYTVDGLLTVADFQVVYEHIYPQMRHWRPIGERLGLSTCELENYEDDYQKNRDRLRKVILEWLRQRSLKPCWRALIEALNHQTVDEEGAAFDLQDFVKKTAEAADQGYKEEETAEPENNVQRTDAQGYKGEETAEHENPADDHGKSSEDNTHPVMEVPDGPSGEAKEDEQTDEGVKSPAGEAKEEELTDEGKKSPAGGISRVNGWWLVAAVGIVVVFAAVLFKRY